jgi:hypothetical protein
VFLVFGSPFGHWGSHNNAFSMGNRDYSVVEADTHIFVSHYPPILPGGSTSRCEMMFVLLYLFVNYVLLSCVVISCEMIFVCD